jgi:hypothetical protein
MGEEWRVEGGGIWKARRRLKQKTLDFSTKAERRGREGKETI